jgi:DNA-binding LacI/PurR family transcriptional regulator
MGKAAADAIVAMLHHETVQHHKLLPLEFVERSTTLAQ